MDGDARARAAAAAVAAGPRITLERRGDATLLRRGRIAVLVPDAAVGGVLAAADDLEELWRRALARARPG